ncbi:putative quinol monooxygenase [Candidatus Marinarcus aquaticus]|uniref:Antibiotic biosynthesis monooxygenase n=1 Tax=Candidatus Marinarcus aquaticus TaxID=2044504 RepID=A0A4V1LP84_9BACT|nr:putative quinol monooxygenase [Candidatus Marinarcus aquaticus]RXJ60308.1 antibiotic biosynthesis monooxygenase [Candidatus Marinarcus aquaticus]
MAEITVIASIVAKPEYKDEIYKSLLELHKQTHANDEGCIQYDLHINNEEENGFTFIETWRDIDALLKHSQKAHFDAFKSFIEGKIDSMSVQKLQKVS